MLMREFDRIVPPGAMRVADKQSDAVAYAYTRGGAPYVQIYFGKAGKPVVTFKCRDDGERERAVREYFGRRRTWARLKAEDTAKRKAETPSYAVGDVLVSSYGYDMTIVQFWQVVAVRGKKCDIREIASEVVVPDGGGNGRVTARPGEFKGPVLSKLAQPGGLKIEGRHYARRWDGTPQYYNTWD